MKIRFLIISTLLALAGCDNIDGSSGNRPSATVNAGVDTAIFPASGVQVGRLYFSGEGRRPAFVRADGTVFNRLCYGDYAKDNELRNIGEYLSILPGEYNGTFTSDAGAGLNLDTGTLLQVANLSIVADANRNRTYKVENLRKVIITDEGIQLVRDNLGPNCIDEIRDLLKDNREIIMVLAGNVADSVSEVIGNSANANVGSGFGSIPTLTATPNYESTSTESWSVVYFGINSEVFTVN